MTYRRRLFTTDSKIISATGKRENVRAKHNFQIPESLLADRDRRQTASQTLTALLCGDPAPGQSALDKRGAA